MTISAEIRDRIIAVADELYEEGGKERFPSVSDVRSRARTDMNSTSLVMKEWRRAQTSGATASTVVSVPEAVATSAQRALATLWVQAQEVAGEALRSAQTVWEVERAEMDAMREEISTDFARQAKELQMWQETAAKQAKEHQEKRESLEAELRQKEASVIAMQEQRDQASKEASEARERAAMAEGELKALREQVVTLMEKLGPIDKSDPVNKKK